MDASLYSLSLPLSHHPLLLPLQFETPQDAAAAINQLHDSELGGRKIFIRCGVAPRLSVLAIGDL
jgi:hypothetical protein